jgi:ribosomal protein L37E
MITCPVCGRRAEISYQTGRLTCPACGWGTGRPVSVPKRVVRRQVAGMNVASVLLLWIVAGAVIALIAWIVFGLAKAEATRDNILIFAGCMVAYGLVAHFLQPSIDTENLGWAGGLIDNPFRISDNFERGKLRLLIFLFPGRFIGLALVNTFHLILHAFSGGRVPPPSQGSNVG